jgi:hypothetical protein
VNRHSLLTALRHVDLGPETEGAGSGFKYRLSGLDGAFADMAGV